MKHVIFILAATVVARPVLAEQVLTIDIKDPRATFMRADWNEGFFGSRTAIDQLFKDKIRAWSEEQIELDNGKKVTLTGRWTLRLVMSYCNSAGSDVCIATAIQRTEEAQSSSKRSKAGDEVLVAAVFTKGSYKPPSPDNDIIASEQAWRALKEIAEQIEQEASQKR